MRLTIVRHGESENNEVRIHNGPNTPLNARGRDQAERVAKCLSHEVLDVLFTSDWPRAKETARAIAQYHPAVPFIEEPRLEERYNGEWIGQPYGIYDRAAKEQGIHPHAVKASGGESYLDVKARVFSFMKDLKDQYHGKRVLLVTHGTPSSFILEYVTGEKMTPKFQIGNASVTHVDWNETIARIETLNDTKHLE